MLLFSRFKEMFAGRRCSSYKEVLRVPFSLIVYITCLLLPQCNAQSSCPGIMGTNGVCYYQYGLNLNHTWQDAENNCVWSNGSLPTIQSSADNAAFKQVLAKFNINSELWLGGRLEAETIPQERLWRWISDCQHCGRDTDAWLAISAQGCYNDVALSPDLPYRQHIPQNQLTPATCIAACYQSQYPFAGLQNGDTCYCGYSFGAYGPQDSSLTIYSCVSSCSGDSSQMCGGPGLNFIYDVTGVPAAPWGYSKPNNYEGYQTCGLLSKVVGYKMDDDWCGRTFAPYICILPLNMCSSNGGTVLSGQCYFIGMNDMSWFDARADCVQRGGDLAKVTNQTELTSIINTNYLTAVSYWIGLVGRVWYWPNGDDFIFANWFQYQGSDLSIQSEPNNASNTCSVVDPSSGYQWRDSDCNVLLPYICQSVSPNIPTTPSTIITKTTTTTTTTTTTIANIPPTPTTTTTPVPPAATTTTTTLPPTPTMTTTTTTTTTTTPTVTTTTLSPTPGLATTATTATTTLRTTTTTVQPIAVVTNATLVQLTTAVNNAANDSLVNTTAGYFANITSGLTTANLSGNFSSGNSSSGNFTSGNSTSGNMLPPSAARSTNGSGGLTNLQIAMIVLCLLLLLLLIIILIVWLCIRRQKYQQNKVGDYRYKASSPYTEDLAEDDYNTNDKSKIVSTPSGAQKIVV